MGTINASTHHTAAFSFLASVASAALPKYKYANTHKQAVRVPQVFTSSQLEGFPLPLMENRAPDQTVTLVDDMDFQREVNEEAINNSYQQRPRTRVYEGIDARSDGWYSLVALHLAGLVRRRVVCSMYESHANDRNLGVHYDDWYSLIVQMRGTKHWTLWSGADGDSRELSVNTGDVLLLPKGVEHDVSTPQYSVHLVFAITDERI